jgi:hypothetical protein
VSKWLCCYRTHSLRVAQALITEDIGHPKLQERLSNVITLMKASTNMAMFRRLLQKALPKLGENFPLDLPEE